MTFSGKNFKFELGKKTYIMGILNVTADSFFDGGKYNSVEKAYEHMKKMLSEGAHIIDIGAQSTRPGHTVVSPEEELEIIRQYLPYLANEFDAVISVDTFYPQVAEFALENGASIINDVSGTINPEMAEIIKHHRAGWVVMHTGGGDSTSVPEYKNSIIDEVREFFDTSLNEIKKFGIPLSSIALDAGIGFGKNYRHNIEILKNMDSLKIKDVALLTALSSKRVVSESVGASGDDLVYGTIAANTLAVKGGTDIIRVHNVKENVIASKMADAILRG